MHILPNKVNQTTKIGQLIECNMRNIFLKDHAQNVMEKLVPNSFLTIKIEDATGSIVFFYAVCFHYMTSWGLLKYNKIKMQTNCCRLTISFFSKNKKRSETNLRGEKSFSCYILLIDQILLFRCLYFVR